jgi:regulation of enolase protein 1 (concanavalin A-like superfamily)
MPQADDAIGKESMRTRPDRVQQFNWGEFEDPAGGCGVREDPDRFTMILPPGKRELSPGQDSNFDAPRLLRDIDGDFSAVVKVQSFELKGNAAADSPGSPLQAAGLVVWVNNQNYLRFLITRTPKDAGPSLKQQAYLFEGNFKQEKMGELAADQRYLNLKREGRIFKVRWGMDGKKWSDFVSFEEVEFPRQLKVGLLAVNVSNDGFAPEFMEFRIDSFPSKEAEKGPAKGGVK